jgi:lipoate-protein ligase A
LLIERGIILTAEWRLIINDLVEPITGVATIEAVGIARSKNLVPNTIIFWRPKTPFICLGYFQRVKDEIYPEVCEKMGIKVARRILGGGTGYVDTNQLLYDVVTNSEHPLTFTTGNIERMYKHALIGVIQGLKELGFEDVVLKPDYNSAIWLNGKKVSGNSATGLSGSQIVGGSLLLELDYEALAKTFRNPFKNLKAGINTLSEGITAINLERKDKVTLDQVKAAVKVGFEKALNIKLTQGIFVKEELELIEQLKPKFASHEWTYHMDIKSSKILPYEGA